MSKKNVDQKGRFRNKIISFRMSEEEAKLLERRVLLSGLTKTGLHNQLDSWQGDSCLWKSVCIQKSS